MNTRRVSILLGCGLALGLAPAVARAEADSARDQPAVASPKTLRTAETAGELLGQNVASKDRIKVGVLKDLVVNPKRGEIAYGLVSSGGLLGIGAELRAVPFDAFQNTYDPDGNLTLDLERAAWDRIPVLGEDPLISLGEPATVRATFAALDRKPSRDLAADDADRPQLLRVSEINGRKVFSEGVEIGEVDDVLVSLEQRRASALLDLNNDVSGSDQRLIIGFDRLTAQAGDEPRLVTDFSREQLLAAAPSQPEWWTASSGYPYVWTGYGTLAATTYSEQAVGVAPSTVAERRAPMLEGRPAPNVIAGAIRANTELSDDVRRQISVEEEDGRLVVSGTVSSQQMKQEVMATVNDAAEGRWQVDDRIEVRAAAE